MTEMSSVAVTDREQIEESNGRIATDPIGFLLRYATVLIFIVLLIVTTILYDGFWQIDNLKNVVSQNTAIGLIAVGMTYVIISGNFDLSVGAMLAAGACFYAAVSDDMPLWIGAALTVLLGGLCGLTNGLVVTRMRVNSLIATLGTGAVLGGVVFRLTDSNAVNVTNPGFSSLGLGEVFGVPWTGIILLAAMCIGGVVLARSVFGRSVYAVGGNAQAARLAGMRVDGIRIVTFVVLGMCATFAGAILASQLSIGEPAIGATTALDAFTIVVIGGTAVMGGEGAMWRTAVGLGIVAVMSNLFNSLTLTAADQSIAKGLILVAALGIQTLAATRR